MRPSEVCGKTLSTPTSAWWKHQKQRVEKIFQKIKAENCKITENKLYIQEIQSIPTRIKLKTSTHTSS